MQSAVLAMIDSVCLSVTVRYHVKMTRAMINQSIFIRCVIMHTDRGTCKVKPLASYT